MGWNIVDMVIKLFYVFAMIAFVIAQSEEALFENMVFAIPQGDGKTQVAKKVGYAGQAIFAPAIGPVMRLFKRKVIPGIAV